MGHFLGPPANVTLVSSGIFGVETSGAVVGNWTNRLADAAFGTTPQMVFGDGVFIALGSDGGGNGVTRSVDNGSSWIPNTPQGPQTVSILGLTTDGAGNWMFGAGAGVTPTLPTLSIDNGLTWNAVATGPFASGAPIVAMSFGDARWMAFGIAVGPHGSTSFSTDLGATWSAPVVLTNSLFDNQGVLYDGTQFVALGSTAASAPALYTSADGAAWSENLLPATVQRNSPVAFGNGFYMIGDNASTGIFVANSIAGLAGAAAIPVTFLPATGDSVVKCVGYGLFNGVPTFTAFGDGGGTANSTDNGATWVALNLNFPLGDSGATGVGFGNNTFVADSPNGDISTLP